MVIKLDFGTRNDHFVSIVLKRHRQTDGLTKMSPHFSQTIEMHYLDQDLDKYIEDDKNLCNKTRLTHQKKIQWKMLTSDYLEGL